MIRGAPGAALALYLSCHVPVSAGEIRQIHVSQADRVYSLEIDAEVDARREDVLAVVTDYDGLHRVSETLVETVALPSPVPGRERRRMVTEGCILLFCFRAAFIEDVERIDAGTIVTTVLPELSDFRSGGSEWRVTETAEKRTRIQLHCHMEPDFWIPPMLGPWLIKRRMLDEGRQTIMNIERLAVDD